MKLKPTDIEPLDKLIEKEGIAEYIRDYYSAVNGHLKILFAKDDFYIADDTTFQPWIAFMGHIPEDMTEQELFGILSRYAQNERYIAAYTNIEQVSDLLQKFDVFTYHEDFLVALITNVPDTDPAGIRPASAEDLPYIEKTYTRSGHEQLLSRINQGQMWVMEGDNGIKGYAGIHKDCSLGFEYVAPDSRRQNIASRMQFFIAKQMLKDGMLPYVMISVGNDIAKKLQAKSGSDFAEKTFYFYAKGPYELE